MAKTLKILHTLGAAGLIGGLCAYMVVLLAARPETPEAYMEMRALIAAISNWLLLPSLALALVSGLFSMAVTTPFLYRGWAWLKALLGVLMFKGVLTIVGAKADYAASVSRRVADGDPGGEVLGTAIAYEWATLIVVLALSVLNVVLAIWRPSLSGRRARAGRALPIAQTSQTNSISS